jgi:hypothetical protein
VQPTDVSLKSTHYVAAACMICYFLIFLLLLLSSLLFIIIIIILIIIITNCTNSNIKHVKKNARKVTAMTLSLRSVTLQDTKETRQKAYFIFVYKFLFFF